MLSCVGESSLNFPTVWQYLGTKIWRKHRVRRGACRKCIFGLEELVGFVPTPWLCDPVTLLLWCSILPGISATQQVILRRPKSLRHFTMCCLAKLMPVDRLAACWPIPWPSAHRIIWTNHLRVHSAMWIRKVGAPGLFNNYQVHRCYRRKGT